MFNCTNQSNVSAAASLDPVLMAAGDSIDDKSKRICGPAIIHKILARNNKKKLQHRCSKSPCGEQAERENGKSCLLVPRSIGFVSPRRLSKVGEGANNYFYDLVSIEQPPDSFDDSEGRECSKNTPEILSRQSTEQCEQLAKNEIEEVYDHLSPPADNGRHTQQTKSVGYVDSSSTSSCSRSEADSTTCQEEVGRILTSPTVSLSSCEKESPEANSSATLSVSSYGLETNHEKIQPGATADLSSTDEIKALWEVREIVLKHQDTLRELADQNVHLKEKLISTNEQIEAMRKDGAEKEVWLIQNHLEKEAFESEASWLREEIKALREQLAELKAEDDLEKRFESLINRSTDDDDKDTIPCTSSSGSCGFSEPDCFDERDEHVKNSAPCAGPTTVSFLSGKSVGTVSSTKDTSKWWNKMARTLEVDHEAAKHFKPATSGASTPRRSNSSAKVFTRNDKAFGNKSLSLLSKEKESHEIEDEDASATSNSATIYGDDSTKSPKKKASIPTRSYVKTVVSAINNAEKTKQDVDVFKSRLDEIQKRRARRKMEQVEKLNVASQ